MSAEPRTIDQAQLTGIICDRPQNFAWFLRAGASRTAGLPTATDIIWDLKRRCCRQQENEDISRPDVRLEAVRSGIQSFIDAIYTAERLHSALSYKPPVEFEADLSRSPREAIAPS